MELGHCGVGGVRTLWSWSTMESEHYGVRTLWGWNTVEFEELEHYGAYGERALRN